MVHRGDPFHAFGQRERETARAGSDIKKRIGRTDDLLQILERNALAAGAGTFIIVCWDPRLPSRPPYGASLDSTSSSSSRMSALNTRFILTRCSCTVASAKPTYSWARTLRNPPSPRSAP